MDKIIKDLEIKTWTKNKDNLIDELSLGKHEQENPDSEPVADAFHKTMDVGEDQSVVVKSKQKRILNGWVDPTN